MGTDGLLTAFGRAGIDILTCVHRVHRVAALHAKIRLEYPGAIDPLPSGGESGDWELNRRTFAVGDLPTVANAIRALKQ
jgi:hypothetical protein